MSRFESAMGMDGNLFVDTLEKARKAKELVCVFRDPGDLRVYSAGYVAAIGAEDYTLQQVNSEGVPDGLDVGTIEDIIEVRRESRYTRQMALLTENAAELDAKPFSWSGKPNPDSCIESALKMAHDSKEVVNILIATGEDELNCYGIVRELTGTHVRLDVLTPDGEYDGMSTLRLDDIAGLQIGTREERKIALFHKHRTHLYL